MISLFIDDLYSYLWWNFIFILSARTFICFPRQRIHSRHHTIDFLANLCVLLVVCRDAFCCSAAAAHICLDSVYHVVFHSAYDQNNNLFRLTLHVQQIVQLFISFFSLLLVCVWCIRIHFGECAQSVAALRRFVLN